MRLSEWKLGLPLSTKVKSDMYKPLRERERGEGGNTLCIDTLLTLYNHNKYMYMTTETQIFSSFVL